jgi:hypothetical protein
MRTIIIRAPAADLSAEMAAMPAMRKWLDEQACEPARFTSRRNGNVITVCVEFNKDRGGEAFKAHFDRRYGRRMVVETWDRMADELGRPTAHADKCSR